MFEANQRDLFVSLLGLVLPGLNRTLPRSHRYSCPLNIFVFSISVFIVQGVAFAGSSASRSRQASPHGVPEANR
jgi:hypothetical protein